MSNKQVKNTSPTRERASAPGVRASVTIEAAFAVPLFMFAVLSLIFLIEIQSIRGCIHAAGSDAAKQAAESTAVLPVLNTIQLKSDLVNLIGEERIERSILNGGTSAISCWKSYWIPGTEEINVVIEYKIKIPVPLMKSPSVKLKDEFKVSAWMVIKKIEREMKTDRLSISQKKEQYGIQIISAAIFNYLFNMFNTQNYKI